MFEPSTDQPCLISGSETDIAWAAGLFDGEGCIAITRVPAKYKVGAVNDSYFLSLQVMMCHQPALERLRLIFGIGSLMRHKAQCEYDTAPFMWRVTHKAAVAVLRILYPHLTVKKEEAEIAFAFADLPKCRDCRSGIPPELQAKRHDLYLALRSAKPRNHAIARRKELGLAARE